MAMTTTTTALTIATAPMMTTTTTTILFLAAVASDAGGGASASGCGAAAVVARFPQENVLRKKASGVARPPGACHQHGYATAKGKSLLSRLAPLALLPTSAFVAIVADLVGEDRQVHVHPVDVERSALLQLSVIVHLRESDKCSFSDLIPRRASGSLMLL